MGDSDGGAPTAPDEPHTRTLVLSVVRGMSEINRHMMEARRSGSSSALLGVAQARERLRLELENLRMLEVRLPPEMEARFRMLCHQAEALLALDSEPIVQLEDLNLNFEPIEPLPLVSHADQRPCLRTTEAHVDVKTRQVTEGEIYEGINHPHTVNRPPTEVVSNPGVQPHVVDGSPEIVSNNLVCRKGELLNVRCVETLSETERARCMSEQENGREMFGMDDRGMQSLRATTRPSQFVVRSPPIPSPPDQPR